MTTGPPMVPPKSLPTSFGLLVSPNGVESNPEFWKYQKPAPCSWLVPLLETVVTSPGCPNSALLRTPSTRSSEIDSPDGNAFAIGLLLVVFCVVIPSTVTSACEGKPPGTENWTCVPWLLLVSACTPGSV